MLLYLSYRIMTVLIGRLYRYVGRWVGRYIGQVTIISRRPTQEWPAFQKTSFACARTRSKGYKFQPDPLIGACGVMFRPRDKDELERGLESLEEKKEDDDDDDVVPRIGMPGKGNVVESVQRISTA